MRWRTLGLRKTRCIGENPVFPQVIYRKKAWIFVTCLEQMQRWPLSRDTEYFQKNWLIIKMVEFLIKDLFCIFSSNFVGICHPLIPIGLCHLCTGIALITFHILIQCLLLLSAILSDKKPRAKHLFNVYLISCINKDYWLIATVDATRWRKIATGKEKNIGHANFMRQQIKIVPKN